MVAFKVAAQAMESMFQTDWWFHLFLKATCMWGRREGNFAVSTGRKRSDWWPWWAPRCECDWWRCGSCEKILFFALRNYIRKETVWDRLLELHNHILKIEWCVLARKKWWNNTNCVARMRGSDASRILSEAERRRLKNWFSFLLFPISSYILCNSSLFVCRVRVGLVCLEAV